MPKSRSAASPSGLPARLTRIRGLAYDLTNELVRVQNAPSFIRALADAIEKEAEAGLGLPQDWHSYALIPIGYPLGRFGPVRRVSLEEVVYADQWGRAYRDRAV